MRARAAVWVLCALSAVAAEVCDVVRDFGAVGDASTNDMLAIQSAIDSEKCEEVYLPEGKVFVSGSLFLRSNLVLRIDGELRGVSPYEGKFTDNWPVIYSRRGGHMGMFVASLLNGGQCIDIDYTLLELGDQCKKWNTLEYVTVTGTGTISGGGDQGWYEDRKLSGIRPTMLGFTWISELTITNLKFVNPAFWTTHILFCNNVYVSGLTIDTVGVPNGDGIDPDSSSNVLIENCSISSSDDVIAIKSGKDQDGYE